MERSAAVLFGVLTFGVHLNMYTKCPNTGNIKMWIARRSATKPTWPGRLDNAVCLPFVLLCYPMCIDDYLGGGWYCIW
jgi:hypothetical protein